MNTTEVYLKRTAVFLPGAPVTNNGMEAILGMVGEVPSRVRERILRANGIVSRYYAVDPVSRVATHCCTGMAATAVQALFATGVDKNAVSLLACGTSYPDQIMPGHGVMVHGLLDDVPPYEVASMAGICVAGMAALKYAFNAVKSGDHRHAVACAAEAASAVMRKEAFQAEVDAKKIAAFTPELAFEKDFLRWMLSDGAGAVYLGDSPDERAELSLKICWIDLVSYANELPVCMYAGGEVRDGQFVGWKSVETEECARRSMMSIKQDVKLLNTQIVLYTVEKALQRTLARHELSPDQVDYFLPHYSSHYFRDKLAAGLNRIGFPIPFEKWFTNLPSKGNTGSAAIYIMLDEFVRSHQLRKGQKVLCYVPESGRFSSSFMLLEAV